MNPLDSHLTALGNLKTKQQKQQFVKKLSLDLIQQSQTSNISEIPEIPEILEISNSLNSQLKSLQLDLLEETFLSNPNPDRNCLLSLASRINMPIEQIHKWFAERTLDSISKTSSTTTSQKSRNRDSLEIHDDLNSEDDSPIIDVTKAFPLRKAAPVDDLSKKFDSDDSITYISDTSEEDVSENPNDDIVISKPQKPPKIILNLNTAYSNSSKKSPVTENKDKPIQNSITSSQSSVVKSSSAESTPNPSLKTPTISLGKALHPYLANGKIVDKSKIQSLFRLMNTYTEDSQRESFLKILENSKSIEILKEIAKNAECLLFFKAWGSKLITKNSDLLARMLNFIDFLPICDKKPLVDSGIGKLIGKLMKDGKEEGNNARVLTKLVQILARKIHASWLKMLESPKEQVLKKLKIDPKKPELPIIRKSKTEHVNAPLIPKKISVDQEKKKITAISSSSFFDNLKLSTASIKIKKAEKPLDRKIFSDTNIQSGVSVSPKSPSLSNLPSPNLEKTSYSYRKEKDESDEHSKRKGPESLDEPLKKKRKTVTFKPDDSLCQIRFFNVEDYELDNTQQSYSDKHEHRNARDLDRSEGRSYASQKMKGEIEATKEFVEPMLLNFDDDTEYRWSESTEEFKNQELREKEVFSTIFFRLEDIPDSPTEPNPLDNMSTGLIKVKIIPSDEIVSQSNITAMLSQFGANAAAAFGVPTFGTPSNGRGNGAHFQQQNSSYSGHGQYQSPNQYHNQYQQNTQNQNQYQYQPKNQYQNQYNQQTPQQFGNQNGQRSGYVQSNTWNSRPSNQSVPSHYQAGSIVNSLSSVNPGDAPSINPGRLAMISQNTPQSQQAGKWRNMK